MEVQTMQPCRPLVEVLQSVTDPRCAKGKRYSVTSLLSLCCAGVLCGCETYGAIAQWGRDCDADLARRLGFLVVTSAGIERRPAGSTLFYVLRELDWAEIERLLSGWMEEVLAVLPAPEGELEAIAVDGKTLRGTAKQRKDNGTAEAATSPECASSLSADRIATDDLPGAHLLSALSHRLGVTLAQRAVPDKQNEITAMPALLDGLFLQGRVVTMDAMLTQRAIAEKIIEKGGTT
jgi:hypothetical protein